MSSSPKSDAEIDAALFAEFSSDGENQAEESEPVLLEALERYRQGALAEAEQEQLELKLTEDDFARTALLAHGEKSSDSRARWVAQQFPKRPWTRRAWIVAAPLAAAAALWLAISPQTPERSFRLAPPSGWVKTHRGADSTGQNRLSKDGV
ncbi:MAG: hypothetical protein AAFQ82_27755, partial [Myxococcota bacterium]